MGRRPDGRDEFKGLMDSVTSHGSRIPTHKLEALRGEFKAEPLTHVDITPEDDFKWVIRGQGSGVRG